MDLSTYIRDIPDFPKPGILFKDITPLLQAPEAFTAAIEQLAAFLRGVDIDVIAAIESRGFLFAAPLAVKLSLPFVPLRKPGKLPYETLSWEYSLEYGTNTLEIHKDAVTPGQRVVLIDDLLATGGTAAAAIKLIAKLGGSVTKALFLVELLELEGRKALDGCEVNSLLRY